MSLKKVLQAVRKKSARLYTGAWRMRRLTALEVLPETRAFYAAAAAFLKRNRFTRLGDYRVTSMPRSSAGYRTPLRMYLSPDRCTVADAFFTQNSLARRLRLAFSGLPSTLVLDFTVEFADGGFLETSNANAAAFVQLPPTILRVFIPPDAPLARILAAHRRELAKQKKLGRVPVAIPDAAAMIASAARLQALKSAFRAKAGYGRMQEIQALRAHRLRTEDKLMHELAELLKPFAQKCPP